jgi:hypothetical protein
MKTFPLKSGMSLGIPSKTNKTEKINKKYTNWKGSCQTIQIVDIVIFYLEDLEKLYQQAPRNHTQFQQVE